MGFFGGSGFGLEASGSVWALDVLGFRVALSQIGFTGLWSIILSDFFP